MAITQDHAWSLSRAGIGKRYHDMSLKDFGERGSRLIEWVREKRAAVRDGRGMVMVGEDCHDLMAMTARAFHLGGSGVMCVPLVRAPGLIYEDKLREQLDDADILVLFAFQKVGDMPLKPSTFAEVEYLIQSRRDDNKPTFLEVPLGTEQKPFVMDSFSGWWWSPDVVSLLARDFDLLDMSARK